MQVPLRFSRELGNQIHCVFGLARGFRLKLWGELVEGWDPLDGGRGGLNRDRGGFDQAGSGTCRNASRDIQHSLFFWIWRDKARTQKRPSPRGAQGAGVRHKSGS